MDVLAFEPICSCFALDKCLVSVILHIHDTLILSFILVGKFKRPFLIWIFIQGQHDDLEAKFFEERAALEAKYQKLYEPLYTKVCIESKPES